MFLGHHECAKQRITTAQSATILDLADDFQSLLIAKNCTGSGVSLRNVLSLCCLLCFIILRSGHIVPSYMSRKIFGAIGVFYYTIAHIEGY